MITALLVVAMFAHPSAVLDDWREGWSERVEAEGMTLDLAAEYLDMRQRHPVYWGDVPFVYRGMGEGVERWRPLVSRYFGPHTDRALCLMQYESMGNPQAKNPRSSARGLFQIMASIWAPHFGVSYNDLYDPETNIRLAWEIYRIQGWWAWSPYVRGLCR